MKLVYFAWVRERIGMADEEALPPPEVTTIAELAAWLAGRGEHYAYAFENPSVVRAAIDRRHVKPDIGARAPHEVADLDRLGDLEPDATQSIEETAHAHVGHGKRFGRRFGQLFQETRMNTSRPRPLTQLF